MAPAKGSGSDLIQILISGITCNKKKSRILDRPNWFQAQAQPQQT